METKKSITLNPYLPGWEYIPDGEPHVFNGRVYVFGSHDKADGTQYCQEDYVVWSAPVDQLNDWTCHGVAFRKEQDPHNQENMKELWAPDVCQGVDGRFYLYYCRAFVPEIGIAVSDVPEGPYEFYDFVQDENGKIWDSDLPFDPGVIYEDSEHIWLYSGFGADMGQAGDLEEILKNMTEEEKANFEKMVANIPSPSKQCSCLRLKDDMKTVMKMTPVLPVHRNGANTEFAEHEFFEASSIRKVKDTYYLVYSSIQGHELCYATSKNAEGPYKYGGTIVSNADLGYQGNEIPRAFFANNHGGMVEIENQWYIFYHRHTNKTQFSRQGCAEPIEILEDGSIPQVEMTSCGLNNEPLEASDTYSAHICCNLVGPEGAVLIDNQMPLPENTPYITEEFTGTDYVNQYVHNLQSKAFCGAKYFKFNGENHAILKLRGKGVISIVLDDENSKSIGEIVVDNKEWTQYSFAIASCMGIHAVYFVVSESDDGIDFSEFSFSKK